MNRTGKYSIAIALAGALGLAAASPTLAAPGTSTASVAKANAASGVTQVQWRRHARSGWNRGWNRGWRGAYRHRGWGFGPGFVAGATIGTLGALAASPYYYSDGYYGSYEDPYAYGSPSGYYDGYHRPNGSGAYYSPEVNTW